MIFSLATKASTKTVPFDRSIVLDNTAQIITGTNFEDVALQDEVTLEVSVWDLSQVASVGFLIRCAQGDIIASMSATLFPDGKWKADFNTAQHSDGFYFAETTLEDILGNVRTTTVPFSVQNWACIELLPASLSNKAGRTMPVKFSIRVKTSVDPAQPFIRNQELTPRSTEKAIPERFFKHRHTGPHQQITGSIQLPKNT